MESWKQAFWLTKYELKHSKLSFLLFLVSAIIILLILVIPVIPDYFLEENHSFNVDILFAVFFATISLWARAKIFQTQKVEGHFWASHFVLALNQLPITKEVIVKYRFLSYFIISLSINIVFLTSLYLFSPVLRTIMPIDTFLVFSLVWCCFSIYIGCSQLLSEVGTDVFLNIVFSFLFLGPLFVFLIVIVFYKIYPHGFFHWTMFVASSYPLLTVIISLLLAVIGSNFWMYRMQQKISKMDYL